MAELSSLLELETTGISWMQHLKTIKASKYYSSLLDPLDRKIRSDIVQKWVFFLLYFNLTTIVVRYS